MAKWVPVVWKQLLFSLSPFKQLPPNSNRPLKGFSRVVTKPFKGLNFASYIASRTKKETQIPSFVLLYERNS